MKFIELKESSINADYIRRITTNFMINPKRANIAIECDNKETYVVKTFDSTDQDNHDAAVVYYAGLGDCLRREVCEKDLDGNYCDYCL